MKKLIFLQVVLLAALGGIFWVYERSQSGKQPTVTILPPTQLQAKNIIGDDRYSFINPAVRADLGKHYIINFKDLRAKLVDVRASYKPTTFVYFAYLNNSSWIGLDEKDLFSAASTVKVPLAMALYRMAEQGKIKLNASYSLSELDLDDRFGELYKVGSDKSFTVQELIGIMLQYSDNTAMRALVHVTELIGIKDPLKEVYTAMGWEYGDIATTTVSYIDINLKTLSNMFLALYNASYVNIEHSQEILGYLAESDFRDQIVAGVPEGVSVAHKIGVNDPDKTYSDCGIVYAPNRPYLLCIGMKGGTEKQANTFMATVSRAVYEYVINN